MQPFLTDFTDRLVSELGDNLEALVLYGSSVAGGYEPEESDINLLILLSDEARLQQVHRAFEPLWQDYAEQLKRAPNVLKTSLLPLYMQLLPLLSSHLKQHGQLLHGSAEILTTLPDATPDQLFAARSFTTLRASELLFDWEPESNSAERTKQRRQLRSTLRQLTQRPLPDEIDDMACFSAVQQHLHAAHHTSPPAMPADPPVPGLYSVVKKAPRHVLFVFDEISAELLQSTDWHALAAEFAPAGSHPIMATFAQVQRVVQYETGVDRALNRCSVLWGNDPFVSIELAPLHVLRHAGRKPCALRMATLPHRYLTCPDPDDGKLVHDFQNQLLNIHLENEILTRLGMSPPFAPTKSMPNRHLPNLMRINKIFSQLDEWVTFYAEQITELSA